MVKLRYTLTMELDPFQSLVVTVCVGRLCLSILPPGWPGDHNRRELGATLSASWLIGSASWALAPWFWLWGPAALIRLALLPAGLRPRHERDRGMRPLWFVLFGLCCWATWVGGLALQIAAGACGALLAIFGWQTWTARADRRSRNLVWVSVLAAALFVIAI